ncbi:MAG TPA: FprA family A-type flavoprotein, partial [Spirochaetota bacterium]|nr:FprA family A-type flavoprotein [Spirochaetota bacterium]
MKAVKLTENIYWVGVIDWNLRNFHGYLTQKGSTYNAYLVIDDKVTLIDTVKEAFTDEMLARISSVIDPSKINYIISNHAEMDHSGAIPAMLEKIPGAELIASVNGEKNLKEHFREDWKVRTVKAGDTLNTGKYTFTFVPEPMVHWPDSMVTYLEAEKILFSNDAFGQHLATSERFDD